MFTLVVIIADSVAVSTSKSTTLATRVEHVGGSSFAAKPQHRLEPATGWLASEGARRGHWGTGAASTSHGQHTHGRVSPLTAHSLLRSDGEESRVPYAYLARAEQKYRAEQRI